MIKKGHVRQFDAWYLGSVPSDGSPTEEKATASFRLIKARLQDRISAARKASSAQDNRRNATRNRRSSTMLRGKTITLVLSAEGFRTLDAATRSTLFSAFVSHVELVCAFCDSDSGHEVLSICIRTPMLGRCVNHVFVCAAGQAESIAALMETAKEQMTPQKTIEKYFNAGMSEALALYSSTVDMEMSAAPMVKELPRDCVVPVAPIEFGRFGPLGVGCITDVEDGSEQLELYTVRCLRPDAPESDWAEFANECALLATLHHDNIVRVGRGRGGEGGGGTLAGLRRRQVNCCTKGGGGAGKRLTQNAKRVAIRPPRRRSSMAPASSARPGLPSPRCQSTALSTTPSPFAARAGLTCARYGRRAFLSLVLHAGIRGAYSHGILSRPSRARL